MVDMAQFPLGLHTQEEWLETQDCPVHHHCVHDDQHSDHDGHEYLDDSDHGNDEEYLDDEYPGDSVHGDKHPDDFVHDDDLKKLIAESVGHWPVIGRS